MPKRTNDYQQFVRLVQQAYAPSGAIVTESVEQETLDGLREIDIQMESVVGLYRIKIAIEAKAESRPLDVTVIEQLSAKYRPGDGVQVDKVVIVSKSGFTLAAKNKALRSNMELLTLREAQEADWTQFVPPDKPQTLCLTIAPHIEELKFDPPIQGDWNAIAAEGKVLCRCHGRDFGTVRETAERMLQNHIFGNTKVKANIDSKLKAGGMARVSLWHALDYLIEFRGQRYSASRIWISASWGRAKAPLRFSTWEQTDARGTKKILQLAVAETLGKRIQMVLPEGRKSAQIVMTVSDLPKKD